MCGETMASTQSATMSRLINQPNVSVIVCIVLLVIAFFYGALSRKTKQSPKTITSTVSKDEKSKQQFSKDAYYSITPLTNFDWQKTEPLQLRPFKPKYHLTMALENMTLSEFVEMDNTYLDRLALRRNLISEEGKYVVAANKSIKPAVDEFYGWMTNVYLPRRFPTIYKVMPAVSPIESGKGGVVLRNLASNEDIPLHPPADVVEALSILGSHVDDEFLFLRPSSDAADEGKYKLEGYINCFPSGFNTFDKLNLKLADIHTPVPGYAAKLEKSMDRFFAALPMGKIVKRHNWSITTNTKLFSLGGNHLYEGEVAQELKREDIDFEQSVMRCERQTLHRLPENEDVVVFAFKTYQYPLRRIKEEGSGEELARAIDGLSEGSVPKMAVYKRKVVWGEAVKEYLRS